MSVNKELDEVLARLGQTVAERNKDMGDVGTVTSMEKERKRRASLASDKGRDKGRDKVAKEAALYQAALPALEKLNEKFAVIHHDEGGRCRVVCWDYDPMLEFDKLVRITPYDFEQATRNWRVELGVTAKGEPKSVNLGTAWLDWPGRREYRTIHFAPGKQFTDVFNVWRGFSIDPKPGDCGLFVQHMRENICGGNEDHFNYLWNWCARMVQRPAENGEVAVVLRGGRGVGKSFFGSTLRRLLGHHAMNISDARHLVGNFNAHLRTCVLVVAEEAFFAGDRKHASVLKMLITESQFPVEPKGVDTFSVPNYVHLLMTSNEDHVIPAGADERRFFVLDVANHRQKDTRYFGAIANQLAQGGYAALLHELLDTDLTEYKHRDVPITQALRDQQRMSLSTAEQWWLGRLEDGDLPTGAGHWPDEVKVDDVTDDFLAYAERWSGHTRRASATYLGMMLKRAVGAGLGITRYRHAVDGQTGRVRYYTLPTLAQCRKAWDSRFGPQDWRED